jgi:hypothetical protein
MNGQLWAAAVCGAGVAGCQVGGVAVEAAVRAARGERKGPKLSGHAEKAQLQALGAASVDRSRVQQMTAKEPPSSTSPHGGAAQQQGPRRADPAALQGGPGPPPCGRRGSREPETARLGFGRARETQPMRRPPQKPPDVRPDDGPPPSNMSLASCTAVARSSADSFPSESASLSTRLKI